VPGDDLQHLLRDDHGPDVSASVAGDALPGWAGIALEVVVEGSRVLLVVWEIALLRQALLRGAEERSPAEVTG
jgi:hypothetical protein